MFSKQRTTKREFVGLFRNIFGKSPQENDTPPQETARDKKSFKTKMKSKLSLLRVDSLRIGSHRSHGRMSLDRNTRLTRVPSSSNISFQDIDMTLNLSSILKTSNSSRSSFRKSLRFVESAITDHEQTSEFGRQNCNARGAIELTESDRDYYLEMKEKILSQNKAIPAVKLKHNSSFKTVDKTFIGTNIKNDFLPRMCEVEMHATNQKEEINHLPESVNTFPAKTIFDGCSSLLFDSFACEEASDVQNVHQLGKMSSVKKTKSNRFDPMQRNESCRFSFLAGQNNNMSDSNMSWCST